MHAYRLIFSLGWFLGASAGISIALRAQDLPPSLFTEARVAAGAEQAKLRCISCHLFPEPGVLTRDSWQSHVLPWMMMINGLAPELIPKGREGELIHDSGGILLTPAMSKEEWWNIVAYYLKSAPASFTNTAPETLKISRESKRFKARALSFKSSAPMVSLLWIDEAEHRLYAGDGQRRTLEVFSAGGESVKSIPVNSVPVSLWRGKDELVVTCMGRFSPSQEANGSVLGMGHKTGETNWTLPQFLAKDLLRPVHSSLADLNGDGRLDIVVSMFGWYGGRLSWFENRGGGHYIEHVLHPKPGALQTEIRDLDGDGKPDIAALFAQATEGMIFFYNRGDGDFETKIVFQKQPAFGHTHFEMIDFDRDGNLDLLVTNGDNGDYESPPKPYHGIRLYLGRGGPVFEEKLFVPLHGAYKAIARDFDGDGDLDIAAISYYPDYQHSPDESFVVLENQGNFQFKASTFPQCTDGRWLTLDAGDLDGDGDVDIVLGAASKGPGRNSFVPPELDKRWKESGCSVMILENTGN